MPMPAYRSNVANPVVEVVSRLVAAGARLWVEGDRLRYSGPAGLLTAEDEAIIREHKPALLRAGLRVERCPGEDCGLVLAVVGDTAYCAAHKMTVRFCESPAMTLFCNS